MKRYQPAISLETAIFLNLNGAEYSSKNRREATELAIIIAASMAVNLVENRQAVGLSTNGKDPLAREERSISIPPRKGREHLMGILEVLARIEVAQGTPFTSVLQRQSLNLPWGCTAIIITSQETQELLPVLVQLGRRGFNVVLILVDPQTPFRLTKQRAQQVGIQAYRITRERDLDVWR